MSIYDSRQWTEDIDRTMKIVPELKKLAGHSVLITGATGLIGSSIVDLLIRYNESYEIPIFILAGGRNENRMKVRFDPYFYKKYFRFFQYDALKTGNSLPQCVDYIIHGAGNAFPAVIVKEPVETMTANFIGLYELLQLARECGAKRVLYISSSEVYGLKEGNKPYEEDEYGYIDLLSQRNSYSVSKRAAETLCISYGTEYGIGTAIVRPGHIYGPTASEADNRVSSFFSREAAKGQDLVMKSDGSQLRSYCYCLDCASAILKVLIFGENGCAYNISNPDSVISIEQMARLAAEAGGVRLIRQEASEEEQKGFNPMNNSSLNSARLLRLGWKGCFDARTGFFHTVKILKEMNTNA